MSPSTLKYGLLLALALIAFKMLEYAYFSRQITLDLYLGAVALAFLAVGAVLGLYLRRRREQAQMQAKAQQAEGRATEVLATETTPAEASPLGEPLRPVEKSTLLSGRELEILGLIANGRTNQEIADALFVSINTVKTHVGNIFVKLEVSNRTGAVSQAKALKILI